MKQILKFSAILRPGVVVGVVNAVCVDYLLIFQDLLTLFFVIFFQNQTSNDHLTQGNLLK